MAASAALTRHFKPPTDGVRANCAANLNAPRAPVLTHSNCAFGRPSITTRCWSLSPGGRSPAWNTIRGDIYRRTFVLDGQAGWLEVKPNGPHSLTLRVDFVGPARLLHVVAEVRRMFDLDADPLAINSSLKRDPLLARLIKARPGLRVAGAWDGFELGVRAILGQQVSVAGASTLTARLAARFGHPAPFPIDGLTYTFPTA